MKKMISLIIVLALVFQGCSVVMAFKQPDKKNLGVLTAGAERENVIAYLGAPVSSEVKGDEKVDIYQFKQGYSKGVKTSRALLHGVMDVGTLFIWELIGMPTEAIANGHQMTIKVDYDQQNRLKEYNIIRQ